MQQRSPDDWKALALYADIMSHQPPKDLIVASPTSYGQLELSIDQVEVFLDAIHQGLSELDREAVPEGVFFPSIPSFYQGTG